MAGSSTTEPATTSSTSRFHRVALTAIVAAMALGVDLWTKAWAWDSLREGPGKRIIDGLLHFEFVLNTGAAFGFLQHQAWARAFFIGVTLLAIAYMIRLTLTLPTRWALGFIGIGLIAAGAMGNLHDRLFRTVNEFGRLRHGVVDFIVVFYWPNKRWPAFNVADTVLFIGVVLFMFYLHRHGEQLTPAPAQK